MSATLLSTLQALADPTRLRIAALCRRRELAVSEVADILGQSQPRVSRHVRLLVEAGVLTRRREGSWAYLSLGAGPARGLIDHLVEAWPLDPAERAVVDADAARLCDVLRERAVAAERFFAAHAEEWDAIRSLHVPEAEVEGALAAMLGQAPLGRLLDVGTGTGRMIALFGAQAREAIALDRSPDMLRLARAKLPPATRFIHGDFYAMPIDDASVDTVILHLSLHYAHAPGEVLAEVARVLAPGGRVVLADFASHDREALRQASAHARLGFDDTQIAAWFAAVGIAWDERRRLVGDDLDMVIWTGRRLGAPPRLKVAA